MTTVAQEILQGLQEAVEIKKGNLEGKVTRYELADVKAIRSKLHVTQKELAAAFDISVETVRSWEQGKRNPTGLVSKLLILVDQDPALYTRLASAGA